MTTLAVLAFVLVLNTATTAERLDLIRTALAVGAGTGAVMTLVLAWRRQWATEHDAAERRLTELYVKAVEQLGSDKAAVRHGALYALERVAQDNPDHRQTVISVICAYLRAPFMPPSDKPDVRKPGGIDGSLRLTPARRVAAAAAAARRTASAPLTAAVRDEDLRQEREVRLTAQRILGRHLRPGNTSRRPVRTFWADIDLDLTDAYLINFDLVGCRLRTARFDGATFDGTAKFGDTNFTEDAQFNGTTFTGDAEFGDVIFTGYALFYDAIFTRVARFDNATFTKAARFSGAIFNGTARFSDVTFTGAARFSDATFHKAARFGKAIFSRTAWFNEATFTGDAEFGYAIFAGAAEFSDATFSDDAQFSAATFTGSAQFHGTTFTEGVWFNGTTFVGAARFSDTTFSGHVQFHSTTFTGSARFNGTTFPKTARFTQAEFALPPTMSGASVRNDDHPSLTHEEWPIGWTAWAVAGVGGTEPVRLVPVPVVLAID